MIHQLLKKCTTPKHEFNNKGNWAGIEEVCGLFCTFCLVFYKLKTALKIKSINFKYESVIKTFSNKQRHNLLPTHLSCENYKRNSFILKGNDIKWKFKFIYRNKEHRKKVIHSKYNRLYKNTFLCPFNWFKIYQIT